MRADVEVGRIKIYEIPYGAETVQYPAKCVVIKSAEEARAVIESLIRFVEAVENK